MNGQSPDVVKQQIRDTLARRAEDTPVNIVTTINGPITNSPITSLNTGTINVAPPQPVLQSASPSAPQPASPSFPQPAPPSFPQPEQPAPSPVPQLMPEGDHEHEFSCTFTSFRDDLKWRLPSGPTVEDILYREYYTPGVPEEVRKSIQHWTVVVDNNYMRRMFDPQDWQAIQAKVKPLPALSRPVLNFFTTISCRMYLMLRSCFFITNSRLQITTIKDLRQKVAALRYIDPEAPDAFDLGWLGRVLQELYA